MQNLWIYVGPLVLGIIGISLIPSFPTYGFVIASVSLFIMMGALVMFYVREKRARG